MMDLEKSTSTVDGLAMRSRENMEDIIDPRIADDMPEKSSQHSDFDPSPTNTIVEPLYVRPLSMHTHMPQANT